MDISDLFLIVFLKNILDLFFVLDNIGKYYIINCIQFASIRKGWIPRSSAWHFCCQGKEGFTILGYGHTTINRKVYMFLYDLPP